MQKPMLGILRRCKLGWKLALVAFSGLLVMAVLWGSAYAAFDTQMQLGMALAGVLWFLYVVYSVHRNISAEMARLLSAMEQAAHGNLTHRITASSND